MEGSTRLREAADVRSRDSTVSADWIGSVGVCGCACGCVYACVCCVCGCVVYGCVWRCVCCVGSGCVRGCVYGCVCCCMCCVGSGCVCCVCCVDVVEEECVEEGALGCDAGAREAGGDD